MFSFTSRAATMKPKVALVKDGFLPEGSENKRGRLSGEAIERCKALAAQGWAIDGYSVSEESTPTAPVVEKVKADPNAVADVPDQSRSETDWQAHTDTGKVGMRTVCNVCRNSLTYCWCPHPVVWVDAGVESVVEFKPRTTPIPRWW